jgi:hypothetical protein
MVDGNMLVAYVPFISWGNICFTLKTMRQLETQNIYHHNGESKKKKSVSTYQKSNSSFQAIIGVWEVPTGVPNKLEAREIRIRNDEVFCIFVLFSKTLSTLVFAQ